jgi:predicted DNA-binding transcriptional regulator YafY
MVDQLERLTNLIALLLETKVPLSLDRIANELAGQYPVEHAARRGSFERDKGLLRDEGVPLEQVMLADGGTGYFIDRKRYELDLHLAEDEKRALQLAVAAVHLGADWGNDALLKLGSSGDETPLDVTGAFRASPVLPVLFDAHVRRLTVSFRYRDRDRRLQPWGLLSREGFWYAVGYEHGAAEQRTFRLDRIDGAVTVHDDEPFTVPEGFDPAVAVIDDPKLIGTSPGTEALVAVDAVRAHRVVDEMGAGAVVERSADGVVVRVPAANGSAFRSWLFGHLDHAEVLSPPEVRADVVSWLTTVAGTS